MFLNCNQICNNCSGKGFLWACSLEQKLWISNSEQQINTLQHEKNLIAINNKEVTRLMVADNYKLDIYSLHWFIGICV